MLNIHLLKKNTEAAALGISPQITIRLELRKGLSAALLTQFADIKKEFLIEGSSKDISEDDLPTTEKLDKIMKNAAGRVLIDTKKTLNMATLDMYKNSF